MTLMPEGDLRNYFCLHGHKYKRPNCHLESTAVLYPMENFCLIALGITWSNCKWLEKNFRAATLQSLLHPGCREHSCKMWLLKHRMDKVGEKQSLWILILHQIVAPESSCVLRQCQALWFVSSCAGLSCRSVDQWRAQESWAVWNCQSPSIYGRGVKLISPGATSASWLPSKGWMQF